MRKTILVLASGLALWACQRGDVSVEMPIYDWTSTDILDISKVEINDSATVVDFDVKFLPKYWFIIDSATTLRADGKDYKLRYIDGYETNKHITMPESGQMPLKLVFEPMPKSTKTFDFIEGDAQGAFRITGIDLTGKAKWGYPEGLPAELRKEPNNEPLPGIEMGVGAVDVNLHLLGYDPKTMPKNVTLLEYSGMGNMQMKELALDSLGEGSTTVNVLGLPSELNFILNNNNLLAGNVLVDVSDKSTDVYVDMRMLAFSNIVSHRGKDAVSSLPKQYTYTTGKYGSLNGQLAASELPRIDIDYYTFNYDVDLDQYIDTITQLYKQAIAANDSLAMPAAREYNKYKIDHAYYDFLNEPARNIDLAYRLQNRKESDYKALLEKYAMPKEKAAELFKSFDNTNPWVIATDKRMNHFSIIENGNAEPSDLSKAATTILQNADKAIEAKISASEMKALADSCGTYSAMVADAFSLLSNSSTALQDRYNKVVSPTPQVSNDKLFEAIVAPYKGKVVVVDFWNTWCVPCRMALSKNEPLKDSELTDPDIVFVYIANETSPLAAYVDMVEQIRGVHYRLNREQSEALSTQFNIDGIPSYVLVDREGNAALRNDRLRNHDTYASTIKEALK